MASLLPVFQSQKLLAEEFGDWGFKALAVLLIIALVKRFPYRIFVLSHRLLSPLFLFLVFHSMILMKQPYWAGLLAPVMVVLMVGGTVAAVVSLLGKVGSGRRAVGEVERFAYLENNSVLKVGMRLQSRWDGHEEGQFAFVTFDKREGAHPFTIASAWTGDGTIGVFIMDADKLCAAVPDWKEAEVLFCGPTDFGDALLKGLVAKGFPEADFHRELFEMR
jgi:predicted ferric reductase